MDAVHLIYYYFEREAFKKVTYLTDELTSKSRTYGQDFENAIFVDDNNINEIIDQCLKSFPVRRYVLSKEGDGVCYIRQSYLLD